MIHYLNFENCCGNESIQKFDAKGNFLADWDSSYPLSISIDNQDNIYVDHGREIKKYKKDGTFIKELVPYGSSKVKLEGTGYIQVDKNNDIYMIDSHNNHYIQKIDNNGNLIKMWGKKGSADGEFKELSDIAIDNQGNIYVLDSGNNRIQKFDSNMNFLAKYGVNGNFGGMTIDNQNNIYLIDRRNSCIQKFDSNMHFLAKLDTPGNGNGKFGYLWEIAIDNQNNIYLIDRGNFCIQKFSQKQVSLPKPSDTYQLEFKHSNKVVQVDTGEAMETGIAEGFGASIGVDGVPEGEIGEPIDGDLAAGGFVMDAALLQKTADKSNKNQHWTFKDAGNGYHQILSSSNSEALELKGEGTDLFLSTGKSSSNATQLWKLEDAGNGYFRLLNKAANKYLEVPENDQMEDALLHYGSKSGDNQLVKFIKVQ